jgi:predicted Zn finger-like uncharacterized protein
VVLFGKGVVAMPNVVCCPSCQARYQVAEQMMGRKLKCSKCGQTLQVGPAQPATAGAAKATQSAQSGGARAAKPAQASTRTSLLEEELALDEAKAQAMAAAERDAELDAKLFGEKPPEVPKYPCPYCDFEVNVDAPYCPACSLSLQSGTQDLAKRSKQETKDLMNAIAGGILALGLAPLLFWGAQMFLGSRWAMLFTAVEINLIIAVSNFPQICRVFHQKLSEGGAMYRVVGVGAALNLAVNWMGQTGLESMLGAMVLSSLVTTLLCVAMLEFPLIKAVGICIVYNALATILSLTGVLLLAAIFITVTPESSSSPATPPPAALEQGAPAEAADAPAEAADAPAAAPATPNE